jgi:hypothetical protein
MSKANQNKKKQQQDEENLPKLADSNKKTNMSKAIITNDKNIKNSSNLNLPQIKISKTKSRSSSVVSSGNSNANRNESITIVDDAFLQSIDFQKHEVKNDFTGRRMTVYKPNYTQIKNNSNKPLSRENTAKKKLSNKINLDNINNNYINHTNNEDDLMNNADMDEFDLIRSATNLVSVIFERQKFFSIPEQLIYKVNKITFCQLERYN